MKRSVFADLKCTICFLPSRPLSGTRAYLSVKVTSLPVSLQLALEDPVHSVSLQQFVYEKLKAQQALMGDQRFAALMESVDTEIVRQLQDFLQGL